MSEEQVLHWSPGITSDTTGLHYPHVAARLFNTPLLVEADKLRALAHGLSTRFGVELHGLPAAPVMLKDDRNQEPKKPYQVKNGIGLIPVYDTLVHRAGWMDAMSGLTSYTEIGKLFDAALADPDVSTILLHIDSPGGEAKGVFDLADKILNAQTDKPVIAFADMAASAAYLIGSAADQLYVSQGALVGSIGVRAIHVDQSRLDAAMGLVVTEIFAGARKADGSPHLPLTSDSLIALQTRVNDCYDLFVDAVARNRGLPSAVVRNTEAAIYTGAKALPLSLIDGVRTLDHLLAPPGTAVSASVPNINTKSDYREDTMDKYDSAAALVAAHPDHAAEIRKEAQHNERARLKAILTRAPKGHEALAQQLAFETDTTPGDCALQFLDAQQNSKATALAGFQAEAPPPVDPLSAEDPATSTEKSQGERLMEAAAERRNQERRAKRGQLSSVAGGRR